MSQLKGPPSREMSPLEDSESGGSADLSQLSIMSMFSSRHTL